MAWRSTKTRAVSSKGAKLAAVINLSSLHTRANASKLVCEASGCRAVMLISAQTVFQPRALLYIHINCVMPPLINTPNQSPNQQLFLHSWNLGRTLGPHKHALHKQLCQCRSKDALHKPMSKSYKHTKLGYYTRKPANMAWLTVTPVDFNIPRWFCTIVIPQGATSNLCEVQECLFPSLHPTTEGPQQQEG